jgi:hypothetical protein
MLKTYNPAEVDLVYGPLKVDGYAEGEFVTVDQAEDSFLLVVGSNGEACRSLNANDLTIVTFKLLSSSRSNVVLSGMHTLDKVTGGRSPQTIYLRDRSGTTLWASPTAWIVKPAPLSLDKQAKPLEWQIAAVGQPPTNIIGGN